MKKSTLLAAAAAGVAILSLTVGAGASSATSKQATVPGTRGTGQVIDQIVHLAAHGASDGQIAHRVGLESVGQPAPAAAVPASASEISVVTPQMWRDAKSGVYYMKTGWGFTKTPDGAGSGNVGGTDGFAFSLSKGVVNRGGRLYICPTKVTSSFKCFYATNYWDNSAAGQAWRFQDKAQLVGYPPTYSINSNAREGIAVFAFTPPAGCLQAFAKYTHTWSSTSVTGVSVGTSSIGFSWSKNNNYWQRESDSGKYRC